MEGIISECYKSHQPLIVNDINRSLLYNKDIDTLGHNNIFKILLVPILDNRIPKNIWGMVWIGIKKGFKQFIQQDIDRVIKFANAVKGKLFAIQPFSSVSHQDSLLICEESKSLMKNKMQRAEQYFATSIHDIRTPMNAIIGFMELMMLNESDEQKKEYINATLKSSEHIVSLINDALDMSKVSNGKMTLDKSSFSPMEGLGDIAKLFYNSMSKKSITFSIYIDPLMPKLIVSDLQRIKQILNNLLSNAMKFTPEEGQVSLEANYDKTQDTLEIAIIDTGIGIAKHKQKSIFNPYTQENDSTSSQYGGTGLGLAISQQLSILLNGTLILESTQGKGSKFTFTFPCDSPIETTQSISREPFKEIFVLLYYSSHTYSALQSIREYLANLNINHSHIERNNPLSLSTQPTLLIIDRDDAVDYLHSIQKFMHEGGKVLFVQNNFASEKCLFVGEYKILHRPLIPNALFNSIHQLIYPDQHQKLSEVIQPTYNQFKGHSILAIDDSRINLKLLTEVLKKFKITVTTSLNGKEALEFFEKKVFTAIFIDQNMPIMNGDEVILKMRQIEKDKGQKPSIIYALTGDEDTNVKAKIMASGANKILTKPIHIKEIYSAISQAIKS